MNRDDQPAARAIKLVLVPLPDSVPPAARLKRLLKAALRAYRWKCIRIEPADGPADQSTLGGQP